uniref:HEAT repeat domain-containing protein n=1 Tax=Streptomyces sp. NBC_00049 TaxID=2903617 RepID=A0AAU2JZX7_9ACTN
MSDGSADEPAHPSRARLFQEVGADRDGPAARRLLLLTDAPETSVRRSALTLLASVGSGRAPWPEAVDAAEARLVDPDPAVRAAACHVVAWVGGADRAMAALHRFPDPEVRARLARWAGPAVVRLGSDPQPAVRFLARLTELGRAPAEQWPFLDRALLHDAAAAARHLDDAGGRWEWTLSRLGREDDTYALAHRLLDDPSPAVRDIGADLARGACQSWRAGPARLLARLRELQERSGSEALAGAVHTATGPAAAAGPWAERWLFAPPQPMEPSEAAEALASRPIGIGRFQEAPRVFGALLDEGPLTFRQAAQLYQLTFARPCIVQALAAPLWLRHAGPSALPRLLSLMTPHVRHYGLGEWYLAGLGRIGPAAAPALPAVDAVIETRRRIPVNDSTRDGETELDERLLAAARWARRAITGPAADRERDRRPRGPAGGHSSPE